MMDPGIKYRDKVSVEHAAAMQSIGLLYNMLDQHRDHFEKFVESKRRMDSVGGLLDPTLYRDMIHSESFKLQVQMVDAALAFLRAMKPIADKIIDRADADSA